MSQSPEEQLSYLGFRRLKPNRILQPYIHWLWYFKRESPLTQYQEEFMHPSGGFGIVFNFGDDLTLDGEVIKEPVFLDGSNTVSRKMGFQGNIELLGIRFYEGGAYPFLEIPLTELRNEIALLDAIASPPLLRLQAQLHDTSSVLAKFNLLENWLMRQLSKGKERNPLIPASLSKLKIADFHTLSIPNIAQELAISQRQLERLYQAQVGMTPIQYARLIRVETARLALKGATHKSNTDLAVDLGFYDQSHFIREFKAVVGMTPFKYMKRHLWSKQK